MNSSYDSRQNEVMHVKNGAIVLDLWLDICFWPTRPKYSFWVTDLEFKNLSKVSGFYKIYLMTLDKVKSYFWYLELGFWTYGLVHLLGATLSIGWLLYLELQHIQMYMFFPKKMFIDVKLKLFQNNLITLNS